MSTTDEQLWAEWDKRGRRTSDLQPLFNQFAGTLNKKVNQFSGRVNVPPAAIRANVDQNFLDALQSYDPQAPANLNTYVNHHLKKTHRFIMQHQNFARIPEPMGNRIGDYRRAEDRLTQKLSREPSTMELADELKWPTAHAERMRKSLRKDLSASLFEFDPSSLQVSRWNEVKALVPYELTPQENAVFDLVVGNKAGELSNNEVAAKLRLSPSRVSKIKANIAGKIQGYM